MTCHRIRQSEPFESYRGSSPAVSINPWPGVQSQATAGTGVLSRMMIVGRAAAADAALRQFT
jgi:hypothetical protein